LSSAQLEKLRSDPANRKQTTFRVRRWQYAAGALLFLLLGIEIFGPVLKGQFVFDDLTLPFSISGGQEEPLSSWLAGVRPVLMSSYWLNYWQSGLDPFGYHFTNLIIHVLSALLAFFVSLRILEYAGTEARRRFLLSVFCAALFFTHPLQTESVDYIAGRSESMSGLFTLAAWCVFLYRREPAISWRESCIVVVLFGLAIGSKENAVALIPLLLLTDYVWGRDFLASVRANRRLYGMLAVASIPALAFVAITLKHAPTAGFSISQMTWYQYFFTEWRAIVGYICLFVLPVGQTIDHDFPISQTIISHGAVFYLIVLVALAVLAYLYRKRYPLAFFGYLSFLILLAPTSSVIPILDPFVERRMYLPLLGLLFAVLEFLRHRDLSAISWRLGLIALVILACFGTYRQAQIWADPWTVWTQAVQESPKKSRPYWSLVATAFRQQRCKDAIPYLEHGASVLRGDAVVLTSWAKALECVGKPDQALEKLQQAAAISPTSGVFELLGLLYGELGKIGLSKEALDRAVKLDPSSATALSARGIWFFEQHQFEAAADDFRASLRLNPRDDSTRQYLRRIYESGHR
jgi:protein O-mannosyl-transferase